MKIWSLHTSTIWVQASKIAIVDSSSATRALFAAYDSSSIDSTLLQEDHGPSEQEVPSAEGRLLFNAATIFTTLTFTQNVAGTKSISANCAPVGVVTLCYG